MAEATAQDVRRIRATLLTIIVVAFGLAATEFRLALTADGPTFGLWVLAIATALLSLVLLWPMRIAATHTRRAIFLGCSAILAIQVVYLAFYARAYPAITIAAFVVVALAINSISGRDLFWLTFASWVIAAFATVWGNVGIQVADIPPAADKPILIGSGLAAVTVGMVLLWQFARNMTDALDAARAANAELAAANEKLRDVERMKSQFINTAAHELNTPMTPVMLQLEVIKARLGQQAGQERSIQVLERNLVRMSGLVREMLDVARLQSGRMALQRQPFGLRALLQDAVDDYAPAAATKGVALTLAPGDEAEVLGDRQRVTQVVSNLLSNALRLTHPQGSITIRLTTGGTTATASVTDTGVGLTREQMDQLFQPFTRIHDGTQGTLGLGLYICRGLVEAMEGRLWADSAGLGRGATFSFSLQRAPDKPVPALATA